MYAQFEQKYEKVKKKKNQLKHVIFTAVKNHCILHGRIFVMFYNLLQFRVYDQLMVPCMELVSGLNVWSSRTRLRSQRLSIYKGRPQSYSYLE